MLKIYKFPVIIILSLILIDYIYSLDFKICAKIESTRKDRIITLLFDRKPEHEFYLIIDNDLKLGKIQILSVKRAFTGKKKFRAVARYLLYKKNKKYLIRAGLEIGLSVIKDSFKRDFSKKRDKKIILYKKSIKSREQREMFLVEAGKYVFGSNSGERDEYPEQILELDNFYIDKYEVTNKDFYMFIIDIKRKPPLSWQKGKYNLKQETFPVLVTYYEAEEYARWAGKRLPTEEEWEKAARGSGLKELKKDDYTSIEKKPLIYPWGNRFRPEFTNSLEYWNAKEAGKDIKIQYKRKGLLPVNFFEQKGNSPYGAVNMAGNAKEWTSSWFRAYKGNGHFNRRYGRQVKVIRGGAWYNSRYRLRVSSREYGGIPNLYSDNIAGFRCVKDPDILDRMENK